MNIHEHQAKEILKSFGAPVANGVTVLRIDEAETAIASLPGPVWVVKSQIHAGGRGRGTFKELTSGAKGGVRVSFSPE
ncbi:MAG: succinate--CoA ligase subunit beta, partial [Paracoccaceae bacterium]|nr:succinate--CoA ligase subunit beta [Paracoccaceae bacterium]